MKKYSLLFLLIPIVFAILMCNRKDNTEEETILKGTASILVDETLTPIIEDQVAVFESEYDAKITLLPRSEAEAIQALLKDTAQIIILPRKLTEQENRIFANRKIIPKVTIFGTDAIALISNKAVNDSLIALQDILNFMNGKSTGNIQGLVFDDPNSSTLRQLTDLAEVGQAPEKGIFSFKTNEEVIKFVSENRGMIGVVGLNWLAQPTAGIQDVSEKVQILKVRGLTDNQYYFPSQNNLAEGKYPLARDLYIVSAQGFSGLGVGFSSFIAGERGQRIILKSGLLPVRIPGRKVLIRNQIQSKNTN
ncbi:MAG TPA: substrate-binding domain-containing protein [Flavobacterium sp.]